MYFNPKSRWLRRITLAMLMLWLVFEGGRFFGHAESASASTRLQSSASNSGVMFIQNVGQFDESARFQVRGSEGTIWLAPDGLWMTRFEPQEATEPLEVPDLMRLPEGKRQAEEEPRAGVNIKLAFVGANPTPTIEPFNRLESKVSYLIGNNPDQWWADIPIWAGVRYLNLYPGVDLEVTSQGQQLLPRFVVHAGADLEAVRLRVEGADELKLDRETLTLSTAVGDFDLPLFQVVNEDGSPLRSSISQPELAGIEISAPFATSEVSPRAASQQMAASSGLLYSTFLGGSGSDWGWRSLALDEAGQIVVIGETYSSDFPTTPGAYDITYNGSDVFISKLNSDGSALVYSTFLGGSSSDEGWSLALDSAGEVILTGYTESSDFPTTSGAYDTTYNNNNSLGSDLFISKLNADGSALVYSTFLGGSNDYEYSQALVLDKTGQAIVTGYTESNDFPTTLGAYDTTRHGASDVFISKLNSNGSALVYSTFLGGSHDEYGYGFALDETDQVVVTGYTDSSDYPTSLGSYDTTYNGGWDLFISKLNANGSALVYSTFLGGSSYEYSFDLALDHTGQVVVTGLTGSSDYPTTLGSYDTTYNGGLRDVFISKLKADGSALVYSTFLGQSGEEYGFGLALNEADQAIVTGYTYSNNFPTTLGAYDTTYNGGADLFMSKLNAAGSALEYSTFLGGSNHDYNLGGLVLDEAGQPIVTGRTHSADFPTTSGAYDTTFNGSDGDGFITKLAFPSDMLAIYALAFDNESTSPSNLSPLFPETMASIVDATEDAPGNRAVVLVDQDGEADTRIFEVHGGVVTPIVGLPDGSGVLSLALDEYDMTDGNTLGGFLKWSLDEYAISTTKTSLSYVSHGTFLAPAVDLSTILTDTLALNNRDAEASPLFPLPSVVYVKSALTEQHPLPGLITPHELQVALDVGTNGGSNPLDVLDVVHCFSASIEEFYELSNPSGTPYSEIMLGSPNYSYFAPEMLGRAFKALDGADDAATMANAIMSAYDEVIDEADQADGDADVDHPRSMVMLESNKIPQVKELMDQMAWYLMQEFTSNPTGSKNKLAAAYSNTNAYYDTTYCPPQNWELAPPDGLVDIKAFMSQIANQFGTLSGTGLRALQVAGAVDQAVINHTAHNGIPWFAEPLTPNWTLSGANISGLALYADLEGMADGTSRHLSWNARFYTDLTSIDGANDNPYPYLFVQGGVNGQTWGDVFNRFWEVKQQTEGISLRTSICLSELPPVKQEGELSVERIIFPVLGTVYKDYPSTLAAAIHTEQTAINPLVRFKIYDASNTLVFSDTVAAGYLVTGTHYIEAGEPWIPSSTGSFRLEVMVDPDNRFLEPDENNNSATRTDLIFDGTPFQMSATTLNNRQWFDNRTIDLTLNSNRPLDYLVVQIYEYVSGVDPNIQVPSTPHQIIINSPSLPNVSFDLPLTVNPGPLTLYLWGVVGGNINQGIVKIELNYAPPNRSLGIADDYYLFEGATGDAIEINLSVNSGNAKLYIWEPGNLWTAQMVNVPSGQAGSIVFDPAQAGKYLVMVEGLTADTNYTLTSQRNGQVGGLAALHAPNSANAVTSVQKASPIFIEPIPDMPSEQIPTTIATLVTLQGRNDVPMPHPRWSVPLNVTLTIPGEGSPRYTFTPTSDEYGRFSITGIEPARYEVRVKKASSLQTLSSHEFTAGSNNLDMGTLYEGDANNDNYITILDFSILASTFAKCEGAQGVDKRADFNGDSCITIRDFSLLASNFGQGGDQDAARNQANILCNQEPDKLAACATNGALLVVEPFTNSVKVGDIFTATVLIEADNQAIDGAQASLNFDPALLEVQQMSTSERLPLELINQFDNSQGTIDFAAGSLSDKPSGASIELLHIQFKALAATEGTTLAFQFDSPRQSDVTFGGYSLLSTHSNSKIIIQVAPTGISLNSFNATTWQQLPLILVILILAFMVIGSLLGKRYRRS